MRKLKNVFDINLDSEEQAIENALPESWENLPFSAIRKKNACFTKGKTANYL